MSNDPTPRPGDPSTSPPTYAKGDRSAIRRLPVRGTYEREAIDAILDGSPICHVAIAVDGQPFVMPTIQVRIDDALYIHGAPASRLLKHLSAGGEACIAVTLLDGLVLARSAFHHSMNYRSVVAFGRGEPVTDPAAKLAVLRALSEHVAPGRWAVVRPPNERELGGTAIVRIPIVEASAKIRTGDPVDDAEDLAWPVWAGVLPLSLVAGTPITEARCPASFTPYTLP